jgi:four helix bundle protein
MKDERGKHGMNDARRPHEALEVYRLAHALALRAHALSLKLPKYELHEEGGQLRRASKSVAAQVVEGHALRQYKAEYLHYLARAYASAEETIEHLRFLQETGSARPLTAECETLGREYAILGRKLFNYMRAVAKRHDPMWADEAHERRGMNDDG